MSSWLIKALTFLLPLFFWPSPIKFELAKIGFFLTTGFFLIFWLLTNLKEKNFKNYWRNLDKIWFLWVGVLFLSTLINQSFPYGFLAGGYRHQSVIFFILLGLFALATEKLKTKDRKSILRWASLTIIIETIIIYVQWLAIKSDLPVLSYNQQTIGTMGEPNALAGFLALGLPILAFTFQQPIIPIFAIILAIFLTSSKAGILAVIGELAVFGFLWKKKFPLKKLILITFLVLIVTVGVFGVYFERGESRFENRWLIWDLAIRAVQKQPVLGYGAEGVIGVYDEQFFQIDRPLFGVVVDRSHNLFLDITLFSGIIGLFVFCTWLWKINRKLIKKKSWVLVSLIGFLVFSFFQPLGVTHWFYLILLISLSNP